MVAYDSMSRAELIETIRSLEARLANAASGVGNPSDDCAKFPVFGERERREFETSPWPIRIFDRETAQYLAVNDAALTLYGYTREEFLELTPLDTRHPEERSEFYNTLAEPTGYLRHRGPRRHLKKSGEIIVVEIVTQDIIFNGRAARLSLTLDVTERVRMETLLRKREQEFSALVENAPDIIARFDRELRHVYVNPAVAAATGLARGAFIGKTHRELGMPEQLVAFWEQEIRRVFDSGEGRRIEFECPCHGGIRYFEARMVPEFGRDGAIETVLTVARDMTERRRAEALIAQRQREFETLAENLPDLVARFDRERRYVYVNSAVEALTGRLRSEIIGHTQLQLGMPPDFIALFEGSLHDVFATASSHKLEFCYPAREDMRHFEAYHVPEKDGCGVVKTALCLARDITERKRAQEKRIADVMRQRDALVREVHHRVKNKLQGLISLLRRKMGKRAELAPILESAISQLQSVATIYGLQSRSDVNAGADLRQILEAICDAVAELTGAAISRRCDGADMSRTLVREAEAVPLALVLNELVFNAQKHMTVGNGQRTIKVGLFSRPPAVEVRIANRGRLPTGFGSQRTGGLALVRTLLAPTGAHLAFHERDGVVEAVLKLSPALLVVSKPHARARRRRKREAASGLSPTNA